jgi:glycosyltransferase involved in cell wall biosynthesis
MDNKKKKLIRITTVPLSLDKLLEGQLRFMSTRFDVTAISSDKDYLEQIGKRENVSTFHLEMTRKITPIKDLVAVYKLYLFLKKERPQIVHTHTPKAGIIGMLASKLARVPYRFHTVAGLPLEEARGFKRKLLDFIEKLTYACATNVYPNSKGLLEFIVSSNYCNPSKLKVLANGSSNGINTTHFDITHFTSKELTILREKLGISATDFVFIFVGRLVKDKGINELVAAFSILAKDKSNLKLLLVGPFENDLNPLFSDTIKNITINPNIVHVGYQSDVRPYFAISNCLVFPSYREGFPNVVMQAGAMQVPAIVSDINGCNEIIRNQENGLIVPVKSIPPLLKAMQLIVEDTTLYSKLQSQSRISIVSRFEQKVVWDAILREYEELVKSEKLRVKSEA